MADRKATIKVRARLPGVAIAAPTDFEQALDTWIWKKSRRKKSAESQVKEEKSSAALQRDNLVKSFSDKRTFAEEEDELTESDSGTPKIT